MTNAAKPGLRIVVIGPKHAGKTVFLSSLANCPGVSLSDPVTIDVLSLHWKTLKEGNTPTATAGTIDDLLFTYNCQDAVQPFNIDFTIPEYDGHFAETLSKFKDSPDIERLRKNIADAAGFIVFMPVGEDDEATMEEMRHEYGSFIGIVREVYDTAAKIPVPLIIVVNKWDKSEHFKSLEETSAALAYIKSKPLYSLIYERLVSYFANVTVIPVSAYGHHTDTANPLPGAMSPYRVTDPICEIINRYFERLKEETSSLREEKAWPELAEHLLGTQSLWKRLPDTDYCNILQEALDACFSNLKEELASAATLEQYKSIAGVSPTAAFIQDFSNNQRLELTRIEERLRTQAQTKINRKRFRLFAAALVCCIIGYGFYYITTLNNRFIEAQNAPAGEKLGLFSSFVQEYDGSLLASVFASSELEIARTEVINLSEEGANDLREKLSTLETIADSCDRAERARQLLETVRVLSPTLSVAERDHFIALLTGSEEVCTAKDAILLAQSSEELEKGMELLIGKPDTPEVQALRKKASEIVINLASKMALEQEDARRERIIDEYNDILKDQSLKKATAFVEKYKREHSPDVQERVQELAQRMPEFYFHDIKILAERIEEFNDDAKKQLDSLVMEHNSKIALSTASLASLKSILQKKAETADARKITDLPDAITSYKKLADANTALEKLYTLENYSIRDNLFTYERPENLARKLSQKKEIYAKYENAIKRGINVHWQLHAVKDNKLDLHCNTLTLDSKLLLEFDKGLYSKGPENFERCARLDGDGGYIFFTSGEVKPTDTNVIISNEPRLSIIFDKKFCEKNIVIDNNDIIDLVNRKDVHKNLCDGTTLIFTP